MKVCANQAYEQRDYNLAISLLNTAVEKCPNAACLYGNRAAAYIKRAWYVLETLFLLLLSKYVGGLFDF